MTYGHCLYTGISSGPNARHRVWEAFTFTFIAWRKALRRVSLECGGCQIDSTAMGDVLAPGGDICHYASVW